MIYISLEHQIRNLRESSIAGARPTSIDSGGTNNAFRQRAVSATSTGAASKQGINVGAKRNRAIESEVKNRTDDDEKRKEQEIARREQERKQREKMTGAGVVEETNTEKRMKVKVVGRIGDSEPTKTTSKLTRQAEYKTKVIDEGFPMYADGKFGLPQDLINSVRSIIEKKDDDNDEDDKEVKGGKTKVDLHPKTNDSTDSEDDENAASKKARKEENAKVGAKGADDTDSDEGDGDNDDKKNFRDKVKKKKDVKEETLDEISKKLAGRYIRGAVGSVGSKAYDAGAKIAFAARSNDEKDMEPGKKILRKSIKREKGVELAAHKLTGSYGAKVKATEEVEHVDEAMSKAELSALASSASAGRQVRKIKADRTTGIPTKEWNRTAQEGGKVERPAPKPPTDKNSIEGKYFSPNKQKLTHKPSETPWRKHVVEPKYYKEENLDELSKQTLGSYVQKAARDIGVKSYSAGSLINKDEVGSGVKAAQKSAKREQGIGAAAKRLTKEEVFSEKELEHFNNIEEGEKKKSELKTRDKSQIIKTTETPSERGLGDTVPTRDLTNEYIPELSRSKIDTYLEKSPHREEPKRSSIKTAISKITGRAKVSATETPEAKAKRISGYNKYFDDLSKSRITKAVEKLSSRWKKLAGGDHVAAEPSDLRVKKEEVGGR